MVKLGGIQLSVRCHWTKDVQPSISITFVVVNNDIKHCRTLFLSKKRRDILILFCLLRYHSLYLISHLHAWSAIFVDLVRIE